MRSKNFHKLGDTDKDLIPNRKKYLQSDWVRGIQYWPYLYSAFNIYNLLLNNSKKNKRKIEMYSLKTN